MVWLGVFHQLHCIVRCHLLTKLPLHYLKLPSQKMLRQWIYRDHYHPNLTESDQAHWESHIGMFKSWNKLHDTKA
ncbi:hypothetical protein F4808DRAFT_432520 [Astrocystis sublimbata]|nr:hypothetical protein F4808DRAFT_432520 [Astrocystis sublimbata]